MKRKLHLSLMVAFILAIALTGCKKYEDGPSFSLASKKSRLVNNWTLSQVIENGVPQSLSGLETMDIKKDNTFIWSFGSSSETGDWAFSSDKESVTLTPTGGSSAVTFKILRLKSKELWLKMTDGSDVTELHWD